MAGSDVYEEVEEVIEVRLETRRIKNYLENQNIEPTRTNIRKVVEKISKELSDIERNVINDINHHKGIII